MKIVYCFLNWTCWWYKRLIPLLESTMVRTLHSIRISTYYSYYSYKLHSVAWPGLCTQKIFVWKLFYNCTRDYCVMLFCYTAIVCWKIYINNMFLKVIYNTNMFNCIKRTVIFVYIFIQCFFFYFAEMCLVAFLLPPPPEYFI